MTELTFLIELLLNHKLPKPTKDAISERIREIEVNARVPEFKPTPGFEYGAEICKRMTRQMNPGYSSIHKDTPPEAGNREVFKGAVVSDIPVQVAQTSEAAAAMDYRAKLLAGAGKVVPGVDKARKF